MFGIVGFLSEMLSPTPIVQFISSGLTLFSYACIAVLSKRMSFKELFKVLMPLNIINIARTYAEGALFWVRFKPVLDPALDYANTKIQVGIEAIRNNVTVTREYLNQTLGKEFFEIDSQLNETVRSIPSFIDEKGITDFLSSVPTWAYAILLIITVIWVGSSLLIKLLNNLFTAVTYPIIYFILLCCVVVFKMNIIYVYVILNIGWLPLATTVDSFLRIYILRALFFRFLKKHPLIFAYSEGHPL